MEKLLSVIIPIYNVEPYLNRCMESIVNQTYRNLEIIMVDDGSPDNCPNICDEWARKDLRIKVIHKKNGGLSDARNKGMEIATGEYIAFVDSDDFIDLNMYSIMIEALERTSSGIATCGRYAYTNGEKAEKHISDEEIILKPIQAIDELLRGGLVEEASWDKVYKRSLFEGIEFPVGEINEDMPIMPYIFEKSGKVVCTGKPLYYYCENPGSITHINYNERKHVYIKHTLSVSEYIENRYPELNSSVREFQGRYASCFLIIFEQQPDLKKKYPEDYKFYREYSRKNFDVLWNSKNRSKLNNLEVLCALLGIYRPIWKLKRKISGRKS